MANLMLILLMTQAMIGFASFPPYFRFLSSATYAKIFYAGLLAE